MIWNILGGAGWIGTIREVDGRWVVDIPAAPTLHASYATLADANMMVRAKVPDCRIVGGVRVNGKEI